MDSINTPAKPFKKRAREEEGKDAEMDTTTSTKRLKKRLPYTVYSMNEQEVAHQIDLKRQFDDAEYGKLKRTERQSSSSNNVKFQKTTKETMQRWSSFTTYQEMLQETVDYLRGRREQSFCYLGPIHDETLSLVPNLIRMHERGLLTTGSQPAIDKLSCYKNLRLKYIRWQRLQQRAFVDFFCPYEIPYIQMVQSFLSNSKNYKAHMTRIFHDDTVANFKLDVMLTRCKEGASFETYKKAVWRYSTTATPSAHGTEYSGQNTIFCKHEGEIGGYMHVFIAKMGWGGKNATQDLLQDILDACQRFKVYPTYRVG